MESFISIQFASRSHTWHMSMLATAVERPCTQYWLGCTDEHAFKLLLKFRYQICVCFRERRAVLGDTWVVLDTIAISRATYLPPSTAHRSRTQAHIFNQNSRISVHVCASVHPFFLLFIETSNAHGFSTLARRCPHKARIIWRHLMSMS